MKAKTGIIIAILGILLTATAFFVYKTLVPPIEDQPVIEEEIVEELPVVDSAVAVDVQKSTRKDNTVVLSVTGLGSRYASIDYEVSYETQGLIQGVNSGSSPIDVTGKDSFEREIYLGTCSKNVCKPHTGVESVSAVVRFTGLDGKKSQFTKSFEL